MIHLAETLQRLEHAERMLQTKLNVNLARQKELQNEEGILRCEMQRIENDKYRQLTERK